MLKLYVSRGASSIAAHTILKELALPHQIEVVPLGKLDSPLYQKNPLGQVPTLVLSSGKVLTQNVAILPYLGDLKPEANLFAPPASLERARIMEWMGFLNSDIHPCFRVFLRPYTFVSNEASAADLQKTLQQKLLEQFAFLDKNLAGRQWAGEARYTIVDPYIAFFFQLALYVKFPMKQFTALAEVAARVEARPAWQEAVALEEKLSADQK